MKVSVIGVCSVAAGTPKLVVTSRHDFLSPNIFNLDEGNFTFDLDLNLSEFDQIRISLIDKIPSENHQVKDTWVEISTVIIDGINLQHFIFNAKQWPYYDPLNAEDFRLKYNLPPYYQPGTKMYLNGSFELDITVPLWKFLMDSMEEDARIPQINY
jgi:hypothetical protein